MEEWFLARGYPEIVVNDQIDKKMRLDKASLLRKLLKVSFLF